MRITIEIEDLGTAATPSATVATDATVEAAAVDGGAAPSAASVTALPEAETEAPSDDIDGGAADGGSGDAETVEFPVDGDDGVDAGPAPDF